MAPVLRVGIVGAHPSRAWAYTAHLPALRRLPQFSIEAVSARNAELAEQARQSFGAARAFGDSLTLARDPAIDIIAVTVKVPEHRSIVLAALAAGKHIYCEWPLGRDLAEAHEMAAAVTPASHVLIGLQVLSAPAIRHAAAMVKGGALGEIKLVRVFAPTGGWGIEAPAQYAYLQDKRNGATLETIGGGHVLAAVEHIVGRYLEVDARTSILQRQVRITGTSDFITRTCADHMLVLGLHQGGCVSTFEVTGLATERPSSIEVIGERGSLTLTSGSPRGFQTGVIHLSSDLPLPPVPEAAIPDLVDAPVNVAQGYVRLASDIAASTKTVPDFHYAARLAMLLDSIDSAASTGARQYV